MSKHTATPWVQHSPNDPHWCGDVRTPSGDAVAWCGNTDRAIAGATAAHIVKCVNLHDELVAALADIAKSDAIDSPPNVVLAAIRDRARAALAKAKEGA
jgi:hypothetical protein